MEMYDLLCEIETPRVLLRPFEKSDVDDVFEYAQNPNVGSNAGWQPHKTKRDSKLAVKAFIESQNVWAIVYKANGKVIGTIGLHHDDKRRNIRSRMLGYAISESYWGMGLATETAQAVIHYAFTVWRLDILSIYHYPDNEKSKRVIEKCGFKYEGTLRHASVLYDNMPRDNVCYSMTREEFEQLFS